MGGSPPCVLEVIWTMARPTLWRFGDASNLFPDRETPLTVLLLPLHSNLAGFVRREMYENGFQAYATPSTPLSRRKRSYSAGPNQLQPAIARSSKFQPDPAKSSQSQAAPASSGQPQPDPASSSQIQPNPIRTSQIQPAPASPNQIHMAAAEH